MQPLAHTIGMKVTGLGQNENHPNGAGLAKVGGGRILNGRPRPQAVYSAEG